ncbi:amino acid ABC transporter ATP-binding protein [Castellaniella sp.]|uniref:amino acid ABC transporter ATP-binding protein n=1 Tax=Castellaniella sp. TaxID=1955812 RepID=UPI003561A725
MTAILDVIDVHKKFDRPVLNGVSLSLNQSEVVCVIGPSGGGKSTLLKCVNWLTPPDSGGVFVQGERMGFERRNGYWKQLSENAIARQRKNIGMVFQHFNLFKNRTALENVIEGLVVVHGVPHAQAAEKGGALLERVGLSHRADAYPHELSGGQQQRVAIARAVAANPALILFDEPTSALDPELVGEVLAVIKDLTREKSAMMIVTHEIKFALDVADRVIFMDEGVIVEQGAAAQVIQSPKEPRTRQFLNAI